MLSFNYFKKCLNKQKKQYSDREIEEIRNNLYQTTELLVEKYRQNNSNQTMIKNQVEQNPLSIKRERGV